jgi:hypothetical protein
MRRWLALIIPLLLLFPLSAQAQNNIQIESLTVRLWPEYDQPSMLIIYDIEIAPDTPLPAVLDIRVPRDGNIIAVAYIDGDQLLNTEYAGPNEQDEKWQVITVFIRESATYRLEYYQPLTRAGNERSFGYQWTGDYPIKNFRVEVQAPGDSTALKSTPMMPFAPNQPFLSGSASTSLDAGEIYQLELSYTRTSDQTVVSPASPQVTASEPVTEDTAGRVTLNSLPYILGAVGVILIIGAVYYFRQMNSTTTSKPRKRQQKQEGDSQTYCHECGTRAHTEDRFCRTCGTKLRNT